jgi:hypothetical protein
MEDECLVIVSMLGQFFFVMDKFLYDEIVHIWQFEEQQYALND